MELIDVNNSAELVVPEQVSNNFVDAIMKFAYFLNRKHKFNISVDMLITVINNINSVEVFDKNAMKEALKTMVCKSIAEFCAFDEIFEDYFANASFAGYNGIVEKTRTEEIKRITEAFPSKKDALTNIKTDEAGESEFKKYEVRIREKASKLDIDEWHKADLINVCRQDKDSMLEIICHHLLDGDDRYESVKKNLESLMKQCLADKEDADLIKYLLTVAQGLKATYDRIKGVLDKREQDMNEEMVEVEKAMSLIHRDEYIYGKHAVRTYADILEDNFTSLSNSDMVKLSQYIRQNAYKFKTKIAMNIKKNGNARVDFKKTVKKSIRADGIPFKIEKRRPKPSKTRIITICDVSGSCIKSSKMLLNFIYEMQSVFAGGCESFVFVSKLASVTEMFKEMCVDEACNKAMSTVPRAYSNYENALREFKEGYINRVNKETVVIFLGDARNNNNPTGAEIIAEIKNKAKKVYWLETDPREKWGEGDSAIMSYLPYVTDIREVTKPQNIVDFLCEVS